MKEAARNAKMMSIEYSNVANALVVNALYLA